MNALLTFIAGLMLGGFIGFVTMCLMQINKSNE